MRMANPAGNRTAPAIRLVTMVVGRTTQIERLGKKFAPSDLTHAAKEVLPTFIIPEYVPPLEPGNHNMMKGAGSD